MTRSKSHFLLSALLGAACKSDNSRTLCKVDERWRLMGSSQMKGK